MARNKRSNNNGKQPVKKLPSKKEMSALRRALKQMLPPGTFESAGGALGALAGGAAQSFTGLPMVPLGTIAGAAAGRGIANVSGVGDYAIRSNSFERNGFALAPGQPVPAFGKAETRMRVRHREFLGHLLVPATPQDFNSQEFEITPSNPQSFPWLADIVAKFGEWKPLGVIVTYISNTSGYSSSGPLGAVALATNYDANAEAASSMNEMLNSKYAVTAPPSVNQMHPLECHPDERPVEWLYTGAGPRREAAVTDHRFRSLGRVQVATEGLPGNAGDVLGSLWITFDIELDKPIQNPDMGQRVVGSANAANSLFDSGYYQGQPYFEVTGSQTLSCRVAGDYVVTIDCPGTNPIPPAALSAFIDYSEMYNGSLWVGSGRIENFKQGDTLNWAGLTGTNLTPRIMISPYAGHDAVTSF